MINSENFYKISLEKQKRIVESRLISLMNEGDPIIYLEFQLYQEVKLELEKANWCCELYVAKSTGRTCSCIYPKQFEAFKV